jgi:hypothetical protein
MRSVWSLAAAAAIAVSALTVGCAQQAAGPGGSGSPASPTPSSGPPAAAACDGATPTSAPSRTLALSTADSGSALCIKQGTGVLIYLKGTPASKWATLKSSSAAVVPTANGHLAHQAGVTGGYFVATQPGVAAITSTRSPCGTPVTHAPPTGPTTSNQDKACGMMQTFRVTVRVAAG